MFQSGSTCTVCVCICCISTAQMLSRLYRYHFDMVELLFVNRYTTQSAIIYISFRALHSLVVLSAKSSTRRMKKKSGATTTMNTAAPGHVYDRINVILAHIQPNVVNTCAPKNPIRMGMICNSICNCIIVVYTASWFDIGM